VIAPETMELMKLQLRDDCRRIMAGYVPPASSADENLWVAAGRRMADIRRAAGLSQAALGWRAGYAETTIQRIELARSRPQAQTRRDIATALGAAVEEIWW